jgi:ATP-dependent DNA ligase
MNGKDYRKYPYAERHAIKTHIIRNQIDPQIMDFSKDKFTTSLNQLQALFDECVKNEQEGIIVIRSTEQYQSSYSGQRSKDRLKIKSIDPVDAVIIGYDPSKKNKDTAETFLLAVYDKQNEEFVTISKAVSGLSIDQNKELFSKCQQFIKKGQPTRVISKLKPEIWLKPSLVVELEVDFIYPSNEHTCGLNMEHSMSNSSLVTFAKIKMQNRRQQ